MTCDNCGRSIEIDESSWGGGMLRDGMQVKAWCYCEPCHAEIVAAANAGLHPPGVVEIRL